MATNFPASLDAFTNPVSSDTLDNPPHDQQHADVNDAMEAVQAKLGVGDHTIGTWTAYTPVFTNLTVGTAYVAARYCLVNDICFVEGLVNLNASSSVAGLIEIDHPVGSVSTVLPINGSVRIRDAGVATYLGTLQVNANSVLVFVSDTSGSIAKAASTGTTVPMSWTNGDSLHWSYYYKVV